MQGYIYVCSNDMDINSYWSLFLPLCSAVFVPSQPTLVLLPVTWLQQTRPATAGVLRSNEIKLYEVSSNKCFFASELPTSNISAGMWFAGAGEVVEIVTVDISGSDKGMYVRLYWTYMHGRVLRVCLEVWITDIKGKIANWWNPVI